MKDLVGDEYELIGEYNGPHKRLLIRHNKCGTTQEYYPYFFLDGGRCSKCHISLTRAELGDYVERVSRGKYKLIGKRTQNLSEVLNTESGKIICMSTYRIRQELQRPTPSPLLPLEDKVIDAPLRLPRPAQPLRSQQPLEAKRARQKPKKRASAPQPPLESQVNSVPRRLPRPAQPLQPQQPLEAKKVRQKPKKRASAPQPPLESRVNNVPLRAPRTSEIVYEKLRAQFGQDLIFTEDVGIDGKTVDEKASILGTLCSAGKITHIATGVYAFPECAYQTEEIIRARYIVRQGHRIGFFRGEDYAYEIGLLTEKPEEWHIATNKESVKTPNRKTMFLGQAIHIKGMPEPITDENHLILEAMDFLVQYNQCTKEPLETIIIKMREHIIKNNNGKMLPYEAFEPYIEAYKTENIRHMMRRRIAALCKEGE